MINIIEAKHHNSWSTDDPGNIPDRYSKLHSYFIPKIFNYPCDANIVLIDFYR